MQQLFNRKNWSKTTEVRLQGDRLVRVVGVVQNHKRIIMTNHHTKFEPNILMHVELFNHEVGTRLLDGKNNYNDNNKNRQHQCGHKDQYHCHHPAIWFQLHD